MPNLIKTFNADTLGRFSINCLHQFCYPVQGQYLNKLTFLEALNQKNFIVSHVQNRV